MFGRLLLLTTLLIFGGCARTIYVSAQKDTAYRFDKDVPLFLVLKDDVSVSEKNAYNYLKSALEKSGFQVVDGMKNARLVMTYAIRNVQTVYEGFGAYPDSRTTIGYFAGRPFSSTSFGYQSYPSLRLADEKLVKLRLFDAKSFAAGKRLPLWEGTASTDSDVFDARLQESLAAVVEKIGYDYDGRVRLRESR